MSNWVQDAGHGGTDPGAVSHGNIEKIYTLEAALYVDRRLEEHGISSKCTRSKDVTLDEGPRTAIVEDYDKGISHHFNAGGGSGVEVIHSIHSDGKFEHMIIEEFRKAGYPVRPRPVFFRKWGEEDFYYMHRETGDCRVTIVEYDFVDGPQADDIKSKEYREGMYECVVRAICRDEGVTYKPLKKEQPKPTEPKKEVPFMFEKAIVINSEADVPAARRLARATGAVIVERVTAEEKQVAKELFIVGGEKGKLKADKFFDLSGKDFFETVANVKAYLNKNK